MKQKLSRMKRSKQTKPMARSILSIKRHKPFIRWATLVVTLLLIGGYVLTVAKIGANNTPASHAASNPLPFDMPSQASLKASPKKVFAHYFTPYQLNHNNAVPGSANDLYVQLSSETGSFAQYGGQLRNKALPQPVGPPNTYLIDNLKLEVSRADNAGMDGFTVDLLNVLPGNDNWNVVNNLLQAAHAQDPNFKLLLMPDGTANDTRQAIAGQTPMQTLAQQVASLANGPYASSLYHMPNGQLVISPFAPEQTPSVSSTPAVSAQWWQQWIQLMQSKYGVSVAFMPCFLNYSTNVAAYSSFSIGYSTWGNRNPAYNTEQRTASSMNDAHRRGQLWMQAVSVQDVRPHENWWDEADNSENLRDTWLDSLPNSQNSNVNGYSGADWVQIPTWNDYSEGAEISPSTNTGWSPLDISSYYIAAFKNHGIFPQIVRDVTYLSHKIQFSNVTKFTDTADVSLMRLRNSSPGSEVPRDDAEALTFLAAPANMTITTGVGTSSARTYHYSVPAGVHAQLVPIQAGKVSVTVSRSCSTISVTSKDAITNTPRVQDLQYHYVSSSRDGSTSTSCPTPTPSGTPAPTPSPTSSPTSTPSPISPPAASPTPATLLGDLDGDHHVTGHDVALLLVNWNKTVPANTAGDLDGNGVVNGHDVALMMTNWGK